MFMKCFSTSILNRSNDVLLCVVAQAISICCTVSFTTSSFKGTTLSVRIGVVPGRYLYFIVLGQTQIHGSNILIDFFLNK